MTALVEVAFTEEDGLVFDYEILPRNHFENVGPALKECVA